MDNQSVKNNDLMQLQQMIIFLRAELAKSKSEINRFRDSDYYSLVLRLERENVQLTKRIKELSIDCVKAKRTFERASRTYHEEIQRREMQRKKHISSIDILLQKIAYLRTDNKQLKLARKVAEDEWRSMKRDYVAIDHKRIIESLDTQLRGFTKATNEKIDVMLEALKSNDSKQVHDYLIRELAEKNNEMNRLSIELTDIKNQNIGANVLCSEKASASMEMLSRLDVRIQEIMAQSIDFEAQLAEKFRMLDNLEQQLTQLAREIKPNS